MNVSAEQIDRVKIRSLIGLGISVLMFITITLVFHYFEESLNTLTSALMIGLSFVAFFLSAYCSLKLLKINQHLVANPDLARQMSDEREQSIRQESEAAGFNALAIFANLYIFAALISKIGFNQPYLYEVSGVAVCITLLVLTYLSAFGVYLFKKFQ